MNDPVNKRQSLQWKTTSPPRPKKHALVVQGHVVFFDINSIVMAEWVPSSHTVNQYYYT
jgi:hypothetical protein